MLLFHSYSCLYLVYTLISYRPLLAEHCRCRTGPGMSPVFSSFGAQIVPKLLPDGFNLWPSCSGSKLPPNLGPCWPKFAPSGTCRVETVTLDEFVPICKMCQFTIILRIFSRHVDPENASPPTAVVPVEQTVHSYHLLLNYHPRLDFRCGRFFVF